MKIWLKETEDGKVECFRNDVNLTMFALVEKEEVFETIKKEAVRCGATENQSVGFIRSEYHLHKMREMQKG